MPPPNENLLAILEIVEVGIGSILANVRAILSESPPEPPAPPSETLEGQYFNNLDLYGEPVLMRNDGPFPSGKTLDFEWGSGSPGPGINVNSFSVCWTGFRTFESGRYTFHVVADDGVRLYIGGQLVIDQWHDQAPRQWEANVNVAAGPHQVRMEYYERTGGATCIFWYQKVS